MNANAFRWTAAAFWLGIAMLIATSAYMFAAHQMDEVTTALLFLGVMLTQSSFFTFIGMSREARDERARKIGTMAATLSWYLSLMFIGFVAVFSFWGGREFTAAEAFGIAIFLMAVVMAGATVYYSLKGDVE